MRKAYIQLHIAVFLAGFTGILGKLITLNEGALVWYRLFITSVTMWLLFSLAGKLKKVNWNDRLRLAAIGSLSAFHWVTFYASIKYANASVGVVCISGAGFFSALLEPVIYRRKLNLAELFLGSLALFGIFIIFDFHPHFQTGIIFGILSALGSALFPIFNKQLLRGFKPMVLANGDELHLGRDDSMARVPELRDGMPRRRAQGTTPKPGELDEPVALGMARVLGVLLAQVAVVHGTGRAALVLRRVAPSQDPIASQRREPMGHVAFKLGIPPRAGAIVHPDRFVGLGTAVPRARGRLLDLPHRDADVGVKPALDMDATGAGERGAAVGGDEFGLGDHGSEGGMCAGITEKEDEPTRARRDGP